MRCAATASRTIDFSHYYIAANVVLAGNDPYTTPLEPYCDALDVEYDERIPFGAHPPLLLRVFSWFCWLPLEQAYTVWALVQALCLMAMLLVTSHVLGVSAWRPGALLFAALVTCTTSVQAHWHYSQVQLLVGAVLYLGYALHRKGRHRWACGLAAFATFFKLYPLVLLPYFMCARARNVRDMVGRVAVIGVVLLGVLSVTGIEAWHGFVTRGIPVIQASSSSFSNFSLQVVAAREVEETLAGVVPDWSERIARGIGIGLAGLAIVAAYFAVWRCSLAEHVPFCLLVTVMILSAPVAWAHYMVLMVLPAALLLSVANRFPARGLQFMCSVIAVGCLMPHVDMFLLPDGNTPWRLAIHVYPLFALLAASALLVIGSPRRSERARRFVPHPACLRTLRADPKTSSSYQS